jgi:hypothetical protein
LGELEHQAGGHASSKQARPFSFADVTIKAHGGDDCIYNFGPNLESKKASRVGRLALGAGFGLVG